ncbi:MAG: hypothetical protein A2Y53_01815 [Chloroflexi bacterium RBG_16_47_49]|nr:MAG: hypothetical protein A2Y53_01815 [Chloroflexi bacterium RBG_16_47_49]
MWLTVSQTYWFALKRRNECYENKTLCYLILHIHLVVAGDTCQVNPGTYIENIDFLGKNIVLKSYSGPEVTIIDGNASGSVVTLHGGENQNAVLDGFTIRNGYAPNGGGIYCYNGVSPTIINNIITQNTATSEGGGIAARNASFPTIRNNIISENTAFSGDAWYGSGGGIHIISASNVPIIDKNIIKANTASYRGGGITIDVSVAIITNNIIIGNNAARGGGIAIQSGASSTITNNTIVGNKALTSAFWPGYGGGVFMRDRATTTITNTILWGNDAPFGPEIALNSYAPPDSSVTISYSDVEGGQSAVFVEPGNTLNWGSGMINEDPLFVDAANNDFHLTGGPCINTGDNNAPGLPETDFEGDPRIITGTVDIGADEFAHVELPRTGQTTCYDTAGAVIACAGTGHDGEIQAGVPWPDIRFTENTDSTVTDNLTGLMWTKNANLMTTRDSSFDADWTGGDGLVNWQHVLDYVAKLNAEAYLGYTDWRLPNVNEIETLVNAEQSNPATWLNTQGFSNVQWDGFWWSSTSVSSSTDAAWFVNMSDGFIGGVSKSYYYNGFYVWPVRSEQSGVAPLWETGQTACYDSAGNVIDCAGTGQDGGIQAGVAWPSSRFTASGDCVTDNLTGLMWTKDVNLMASRDPGFDTDGTLGDGAVSWRSALDYANGLSLCGYADWRLPNRKELHSLTDFSRNNPALPSNHPFLNVVPSSIYWSSTTYALSPFNAWFISWNSGYLGAYGKSNYYSFYGDSYVWPVRGGNVATLEICDGIDNDGDGQIDEGLTNTYYEDADGDTYGNASVTTQACAQPLGYVTDSTDCNDSNGGIYPGATEACNLADDNCDGNIDEGVQNAYYHDADGDTYGNASVTTHACTAPSGYVSDSTDCNDANTSINPGVAEVCSNGTDDNCNTQIDEGCSLSADLSITNVDSSDPLTPAGQDVTYSITVTNNGPAYATGVTVTDVLDASLTLVSATPSQGEPCTGTGTITCNLGSLISGASATVTVVATTSPTPGMIGSTASVTATEPDPNLSNNSATQTTNVGDVSRQVGISTRGYVDTGTGIMVGGFSFGGTVSKRVLIRGRGPSMSGAPYNFTGTLTNPTLEIYSGPTLFATVDDWQAGAMMCNAPAETCGTPAELQAALTDPCQPNVGQTTAPPGCMQEAALYITLPPGAYTAKLKGVNNEVGKGIIEVYDADTASLTMLGGISTRGKVLTGTDVMVGGFIVGAGTTNKTLLLRGRGPSLSGAPYNFTGTLSNPTLEIYSGPTLFATVDDWQSGAVMCNAPAISCGTPAQLETALVDPCQPNAGQTTAPPGCTQESAMFITLPPGAYTAKLKGVNDDTGIGIFEVYEMP